MEKLLEVNAVSDAVRSGFWLKQKTILKYVSLDVSDKSVFGFIGPNGAGKTSLIKLIVGLRSPLTGQILFRGKNVCDPTVRQKLGYVPERPDFHEGLTGDEFLHFFGALSWMPMAKIKSRIPEVLKLVDLKNARHKKLKHYSKGMLQRIGIAQALIHDPELLILDEPMSGLDPRGRRSIHDLIKTLHSEGRTIFFSTHYLFDVENLCSHMAWIRLGELGGCGAMNDFFYHTGREVEIAVRADKLPSDFASCLKEQGRDGVFILRFPTQNDSELALKKIMDSKQEVLWVKPVPAIEKELFGDAPINE